MAVLSRWVISQGVYAIYNFHILLLRSWVHFAMFDQIIYINCGKMVKIQPELQNILLNVF